MIKSLQSLRFVFVMLVVLSHIIGKSFDFGGECGVAFFFVLSGFVLSYAYGRQVRCGQFQQRKFLTRQLSKLYPLHLLTFLAMVVLDMRLGHVDSWIKLVANMLLLQSWVPSDDFYFVANGSSWFLSDLLFFYVVFPPLYRWLSSSRIHQLLLAGSVVLALYVGLAVSIPLDMVNPLLYASPLTRLIDFAIGILLYRYYASSAGNRVAQWFQRQQPAALSLIEAGLLLWVVLSFFVYQRAALGFRCASLFWGVIPVLIYIYVVTDTLRGAVTWLLHRPVLMWLGGISFEIYLTHWLTMRVFYSMLLTLGMGEESRCQPLVFVTTLLVIIAVSYIVKRCFVDKVYAVLIKRG